MPDPSLHNLVRAISYAKLGDAPGVGAPARPAGEITRANFLDHLCDLNVSPSPPAKSPAYIRGWDDALLMVRALARHARGAAL